MIMTVSQRLFLELASLLGELVDPVVASQRAWTIVNVIVS